MQQNHGHVLQAMVQHLPKGNCETGHPTQILTHTYQCTFHLRMFPSTPKRPWVYVCINPNGLKNLRTNPYGILDPEFHPNREGREVWRSTPKSLPTPQLLILDRGLAGQKKGGKKWEDQGKEEAKAMATPVCPLKLEWIRNTLGDSQPD